MYGVRLHYGLGDFPSQVDGPHVPLLTSLRRLSKGTRFESPSSLPLPQESPSTPWVSTPPATQLASRILVVLPGDVRVLVLFRSTALFCRV